MQKILFSKTIIFPSNGTSVSEPVILHFGIADYGYTLIKYGLDIDWATERAFDLWLEDETIPVDNLHYLMDVIGGISFKWEKDGALSYLICPYFIETTGIALDRFQIRVLKRLAQKEDTYEK